MKKAKETIFLNLKGDIKEFPAFINNRVSTKREILGEFEGSYVVKFFTLSAARRIVQAYKRYVKKLGYQTKAPKELAQVYLEIGEFNLTPLEENRVSGKSFFTLKMHNTEK